MVKIGNITYNLYSHSLLQFGQNVAFDLLRESLVSRSPDSDATTEYLEKEKLLDRCAPSGYSHSMKPGTLSPGSTAERSKYPSALQPRGNFSECRSAALMLLQKGKERCTYQHCYIGSTFIPKLQGNSSAYIVAILHDSLGIALDDERIGFTNHVGDVPLDWALGAFILQSTADMDAEQPPNWMATTVSNDSHTFIALIVIVIIVMFVAGSLSKWRKPQLKTIYDLEKGKYIITRVSRYS